MSPDIRIGKELVASVPDITGIHQMLDGSPLYVNVDGINGNNNRQTIIVEAAAIGGKRVIELTQQGIGTSSHPKRGDGQEPKISIALSDKPIRISYRDREFIRHPIWARPCGAPDDGYYKETKRTYINPYWTQNRRCG